MTRLGSGLMGEPIRDVSMQSYLLITCSVQQLVVATMHNQRKSIATNYYELPRHFSTPLIAARIDDRNSTHPYPPPTIDWLTTQMNKCIHGHDLTNNYYARSTRTGKLIRACKSCAKKAAMKSALQSRTPIDVFAHQHAILERRLEHAMPWDKESIIIRMKQLSQQMQ